MKLESEFSNYKPKRGAGKRKNGKRACDLNQVTLLGFVRHAHSELPTPQLSTTVPYHFIYLVFRLSGVIVSVWPKVGISNLWLGEMDMTAPGL